MRYTNITTDFTDKDFVNGTTHVLVQNKLPDLISGSLVYCFRIPAGRSSDHGSSFSK